VAIPPTIKIVGLLATIQMKIDRGEKEIFDAVRDPKNSMLYWYPLVKNVGVLQPKTEILKIGMNLAIWDYPDDQLHKDYPKIKETAEKIGYPLFIRTDLASGKHGWEETCFVPSENELYRHISNVLEFNYCADVIGLPCQALVFREYIPMKCLFTAFHSKMPVNPEIRFFVRDGKVLCWHWYWIQEAIKFPSIENWKEIIQKEKKNISKEEILYLTTTAKKIAQLFEGYWSIDFCKSKQGDWILIDMALGKASWHEKTCLEGKK